MILRKRYLDLISQELEIHSVVAIIGPRQVGKTTLAKEFAAKHKQAFTHFDLENPIHLSQLENPVLALESLEGLIIIDEIQLKPNLFPYLRYIVDSFPNKKFLILGSASKALINQSSESLAGRIGYIELTPFTMNEVRETKSLFQRGGFPKSYLASSDANSLRWRNAFIKTFLERDLASLGINISSGLM